MATARTTPVDPMPSPRRGEAPLPVAFSLRPEPWFHGLCAVAAALVALHLAVYVAHFRWQSLPWLLRSLFDLDEEQSFGTWYAAILLLAAAGSAWLCARHAGRTEQRGWLLLGAGFVLLSIDEIAGLHETLNTVSEWSWALAGAVVAVAAGAASLPFLRRLPRGTRIGLLASGALYVGGAVGVELATEPFAERDRLDTLAYHLTTALEEGLEMAGAIGFVGVALGHAQRRAAGRNPSPAPH